MTAGKDEFDKINDEYGEKDMYESSDNMAAYYANPYLTDTIRIIERLLENPKVNMITVIPAKDKTDDYNLIKTEWEGE